MNVIDDFINDLANFQNTSTVTNPYLNSDVANNLKLYLETMSKCTSKPILLVGEAPGFKGCKITGIPFTSGTVFERFDHPILKEIKDDIVVSKVEAEKTATIVWEYLTQKSTIPLFWNSFPFHPHHEYNENSNRAPTNEEINIGMSYLQRLESIFQPVVIAGIGRKGELCAKKAFPDKEVMYIRHPSNGGKSDFIKGMNKLII